MNAEIITTGEEVLTGQIVDTNGPWIAQWLIEHGFSVARRVTVGDRLEDLTALFLQRSEQADVVIVNGGLGPTTDDLSAEAVAHAADVPLVLFPEWVDHLREKFQKLGRDMPERNVKQAWLPEGAHLLDNAVGTACGFVVKLNRAYFYFTPGPRHELHRMMSGPVLAHMSEHLPVRVGTLLKRINCLGVAEARVNDLISHIQPPPGITVGFRAHFPLIEIKIMASAQMVKETDDIALAIRQVVAPYLAFEDDKTMEACIHRLMTESNKTLALAESCTGGMLASRLVDVPGSSAFFERGFVTYTNQAKTEMVDVAPALIEAYGAVSQEVARAMAFGAKRRAGSSYALAITGVAGPDGGSDEKPVGTVAFGLATPDRIISQMCRLPRWGRSKIRLGSCFLALDMLRRHLSEQPIFGDHDYIDRVSSFSEAITDEVIEPPS